MELLLIEETLPASVYYDTHNAWLFADWHGDLTLPLVQTGCLTIAQCFLAHPCTRILNSNADVTYISADVPPWLAQEYLPNLGMVGVEYLAWVRSPHVQSKSRVNQSVRQVERPAVVVFDDLAEAYAWLQQVNLHNPKAAPLSTSPEQQVKLAARIAAFSAELAHYQQG